MSQTTAGRIVPTPRAAPSARQGLAAATDWADAAWRGFRQRLLARQTQSATSGLENRLRADIGLGPGGGTAPDPTSRLSPLADAWMR